MYIFIDEAGGFQQPSGTNLVSCVAALVVPESVLKTLLRKVRRLTRPWRTRGREVKGSRLSESQMAQVISTIRRFDVLFLAVAIDMGLHSEAGITAHRESQAQKVLKTISDRMDLSVRYRMERLAAGVRALPNQLYVQSVLLTKLVDAVIRCGSLYYAQRLPKTLSKFSWRLDAKDVVATKYETLWQEIVGPSLQTESLSKPLAQLDGADYSAFERFLGELPLPPEHLRPHVGSPNEAFAYMDIDAMLADLKFCNSERFAGVQAVDMLASAVRRACNGTIQPKGWKGIGRLMPRPERGTHAVRFLELEDSEPRDVSYAKYVREWDRETKRMIV